MESTYTKTDFTAIARRLLLAWRKEHGKEYASQWHIGVSEKGVRLVLEIGRTSTFGDIVNVSEVL
jgi:hypothetical protein